MTAPARCGLRLGLTLACAALALSACSSSTPASTPTTEPQHSSSPPVASPRIKLSDVSLQPSGWVPIDYGHAQISVPADWRVNEQPGCVFPIKDTVLIGGGAAFCSPVEPSGAVSGPSIAIERYQAPPEGISSNAPSSSKRLRLNGFTLFGSGAGSYDVPALGISLYFFGRVDRRVLDTLTRSPRAVALGRSGASPVSALWRRVTFAGVSFAVPATWAVSHTPDAASGAPICSDQSDLTTTPPSVVLSTDALPGPIFNCLLEPNDQRPFRPQLGVVVNMKAGATSVANSGYSASLQRLNCRLQASLRLCVDPLANAGILEFSAQPTSRPGAAAASVEIGLAGSGLVDRTIFGSFRAA
jgi:hypothetical protein